MKTYSTKANARRALKAIGDYALAAADQLIQEIDGQFGFDKEAAELVQYEGSTGITGTTEEELVTPVGFTHSSDAELDKEFIDRCGHATCPECSIHLSNGLLDFVSVVESMGSYAAAYAAQQHQWSCMACGAEFGDLVAPPAEPAPKLNKSIIEKPCVAVWNIAESMPGAKRKEVLEACVAAGIAYYTARTQYQQWKSLQPKAEVK